MRSAAEDPDDRARRDPRPKSVSSRRRKTERGRSLPALDRKPNDRYHHGNLREAMIDAAIRLISSSGVDGFTLREAARLVGVNHRAVYRHFSDKTALLAEVSQAGWVILAADMRKAATASGPAPAERMAANARAYIRFAWTHPWHYRVMVGPRLAESGRFPDLDATATGAVRWMGEPVRQLVGGDAELGFDLGVAAFSMILGYCELVLSHRLRMPSAAAAGLYFSQLLSRVFGPPRFEPRGAPRRRA
jgi:AcrR family transcriptional regulator